MRRCFRPAEEARPSAPVDPEEDGRGEIERRVERKREEKDQEGERPSDDEVVARIEEQRRRATEGAKKRERERKREKANGRGRENEKERAPTERQRILGRKQLLARCNENIRASVSQ